jgi:hypothetical protein
LQPQLPSRPHPQLQPQPHEGDNNNSNNSTCVKTAKTGQASFFPVKLWRILAEPAYSDAISWTTDREFTITDVEAFERDVLPRHFRSARYSSFKRQLSYFSFVTVGKNSYSHPNFDSKNPSAVCLIKRKTNTVNKKSQGQYSSKEDASSSAPSADGSSHR